VKWGWVAFDVALAMALLSLTRRWRDRLARGLMIAIGADVVLTTVQVATWNVRHLARRTDAFVLALAIAAPLLAFVALWRARIRRR
jgi:phosphatidylglycerol lysyltransferase